MKTSIPSFLSLGAVLTTLALASGCSAQNSSPQASSPPATNPPPATVATTGLPETSVMPITVATAVLPPYIAANSPLASVVRLTQSGVDQSIIMVYVTNSSRTFNLDSEKIIYVSDLGMPNELVRAMLQRDQQLQQEFATAQAAQQAEQIQEVQPQPAPVTELAAEMPIETITQPAPVTVNYFNETLSPYGNWVVVEGYGRCWQPTAVAYNPNWQPYCDRGRWVYTDCGWYWSSDYAWRATFQYGRWFRAANVGWCWYPDTVWAPSWVTWRYSDNYCGWAPLPPRTYCQTGVGIVYQSGNVSVGLNFGLTASCYTFVPVQNFCNPNPKNYSINSGQVTQIYNNTKIVNNIKIKGNGNNQIVINNGIPVQNIANTSQHPVRQVPVRDIDQSFANSPRRQPMHSPVSTGNVNQPGNTLSATAQNPSPANNLTGSGRGHQSRLEASAQDQVPPRTQVPQRTTANQTPPTAPAQFAQSTTRSQPTRNNLTTAQPRPTPTVNNQSPSRINPVQTRAANFNPQPAPVRSSQPVVPQHFTQNQAPRQNVTAQNRNVAPPVNYSTPAPAQPQTRSYSAPRSEARQNYSAPQAMSAPQPQRSAPSTAASPAPQSQGSGRMGNQSWGMR